MLESKPFIDCLLAKGKLSGQDWEVLLNILGQSKTDVQYLADLAREVQRKNYGNRVFLRALVEISNYCPNSCTYCGISRWNSSVCRYRLTPATIINSIRHGYEIGYRSFVLQGGEDPYFKDEVLVNLIHSIKGMYPEIALTLSVGERSRASYQVLFEAGADRYLLRHETANETRYQIFHPGMSFKHRIESIKTLKDIGFQTGTGFLVGLPGLSISSYAADFVFMQDVQPHMIGIGPFIPHHSTPLASENPGNIDQVKILISLLRIAFPTALIPATTALGTLDPASRFEALTLGANVLMPNITPLEQRKNYALYDGKRITQDESAEELKKIMSICEQYGMQVELSRGDHNQYLGKWK